MSAVPSTAPTAPKAGEIADGELVRRVRRGDDCAFEGLYHRYHRRITAYIFGMVHDHARAEDVAQDVFVSALRRMRETDRPIAFKPWIYEIAKNACIDQFRRSKRAEEVSYDADEGLGAADYGRLTSNEALPETELESKQSLDHLRGAFGGLSETHHEILVMRELEGLSYREIGERLGMSRPSVESTLFRARRRLTEEYEELVSGARCQRIQSIIASASASAPGARDQRRLARHVSHCQPCRRQARLAGLDVPVTAEHPVRARIAAVLPLPLFLRKRWSSEGGDAGSSVAGTQLGGFAQWSSQLGAAVDPGWFKAAATAVTVAVAGAGAGFAGSTSAPGSFGTFNSVIPSLSGGSDDSSAVAGLRPAAAPAVRTTTDALGASVATSTAGAVAGGASGALAGSTGAAVQDSLASAAPGAPLGAVEQAAAGLTPSDASLAPLTAGTAPAAAGGETAAAPQTAQRAPAAPEVEVPAAPAAPSAGVQASAPAAPAADAPSAPAADAPATAAPAAPVPAIAVGDAAGGLAGN